MNDLLDVYGILGWVGSAIIAAMYSYGVLCLPDKLKARLSR